MLAKSILISGATGGIGLELVAAARVRWPDAKIFCLARDQEKLTLLRNEYPSLLTLACELTDFNQIPQISAFLEAETDQLDLVIHTVGVLNGLGKRPEKSLAELASDSLMEAFKVNTMSALWLAQAVKPFLRRSGADPKPSVFIILSAKVGSIGDNQLGGWYAYRMSKAALNQGIKTMALEFQRSNCPCALVAVHPGTTLTDFSKDYVKSWPDEKLATPKVSAERLLKLAESLSPERSGQFMHWDGSPLPW